MSLVLIKSFQQDFTFKFTCVTVGLKSEPLENDLTFKCRVDCYKLSRIYLMAPVFMFTLHSVIMLLAVIALFIQLQPDSMF